MTVYVETFNYFRSPPLDNVSLYITKQLFERLLEEIELSPKAAVKIKLYRLVEWSCYANK